MNKEKEIAQELFDNDFGYLVRQRDGYIYAYVLMPYRDAKTKKWCSSVDTMNNCINWNNKHAVYQWQRDDDEDGIKIDNSQDLFKFIDYDSIQDIYDYLNKRG